MGEQLVNCIGKLVRYVAAAAVSWANEAGRKVRHGIMASQAHHCNHIIRNIPEDRHIDILLHMQEINVLGRFSLGAKLWPQPKRRRPRYESKGCHILCRIKTIIGSLGCRRNSCELCRENMCYFKI